MKSVLNGSAYNTDTSVNIGSFRYLRERAKDKYTGENMDYEPEDVQDTEHLFRRKKDGAYFMIGFGTGKYGRTKHYGSPAVIISVRIPLMMLRTERRRPSN